MYRDQGNPMAWMMTIAKNLFLMKCRKERLQCVNYEDVEYQLGFEDMTNIENRMVLEKMFEILSTDDRNIIIMHDVSGLKHREIESQKQKKQELGEKKKTDGVENSGEENDAKGDKAQDKQPLKEKSDDKKNNDGDTSSQGNG